MSEISTRRPALDGLRGLAALVVVFGHCLVISPSLSGEFGTGINSNPRSWAWWATFTPFHLVWAGSEAVFVFFVLSGLVLALPAASGRRMRWRSYYPERLLRLYAPALAAIGFALCLFSLVRQFAPGISTPGFRYDVSSAPHREILRTALLVLPPSRLDPPLWSLKWEVIFSLLLPVFILLLVKVRGLLWSRVVVLMLLIAVSGPSGHNYFLYLPIFGLGVVMAQQHQQLDRSGAYLDLLPAGVRLGVAAGTCLLLTCRWWLPPVPGFLFSVGIASLLATILGACLAVWLFASSNQGTRLGTHVVVSWLGKRSFSLYLVHQTIITSVDAFLGQTTNAVLVLILSVPMSLLMAEVFGRLVEGPSHRLAKRFGRMMNLTLAKRLFIFKRVCRPLVITPP